ncbi:MAG: hypothetical protein WC760_06245 [Bacteroidia bacterium]|jgi:hypothetical protein
MTLFVHLNRFVVTLSFCWLFNACQMESNPSMVIEGRLVNRNNTGYKWVFLYRYADPISLAHLSKLKVDSTPVTEEGTFRFKLKEPLKSDFIDLGNESYIFAKNIFITRGERLKLIFDVSKDPPEIMNRDIIGKYNQMLQDFSDTFYRDPVVKQYYYVGSNFLLAPAYATYIDKRREAQLKFAKNLLNDPETDTVFKTFLQSEINYQWANDKIAFLWKKWVRNEEVPLKADYYNFLHELPLNNPPALISPAYFRFLELYIRELHRQLPIGIQMAQPAVKLKCDLAREKLTGLAYKVALWQILTEDAATIQSLTGFDQVQKNKVDQLARHMVELTGDSTYLHYQITP